MTLVHRFSIKKPSGVPMAIDLNGIRTHDNRFFHGANATKHISRRHLIRACRHHQRRKSIVLAIRRELNGLRSIAAGSDNHNHTVRGVRATRGDHGLCCRRIRKSNLNGSRFRNKDHIGCALTPL